MAHFLLNEDGTYVLQEDLTSLIILDGNYPETDPFELPMNTIVFAREVETVSY